MEVESSRVKCIKHLKFGRKVQEKLRRSLDVINANESISIGFFLPVSEVTKKIYIAVISENITVYNIILSNQLQ